MPWLDELLTLALLGVAATDMMLNRALRPYRILLACVGVMAAYAVFSIIFRQFNTPRAILVDMLIQLKPFVAFGCMMAVGHRFSAGFRELVTAVAAMNSTIALVAGILFGGRVFAFGFHVYVIGLACLVSSLSYLWVHAMTDDSRMTMRTRLIASLMLLPGLLCGRSKFLGEMALILPVIWLYGMNVVNTRGRVLRMIFFIAIAIVAVGWQKLNLYYVPQSETEQMARPMLYVGASTLLGMYPLMGSGLASFASAASVAPYSTAYVLVGLDKIYGLSRSHPSFICDTYYPSLAQFGLIGIALIVAFWIWVARRLIQVFRHGKRLTALIGFLIIISIAIEGTGDTEFVNSAGFALMMILGAICSDLQHQTKTITDANFRPLA